MAIKVKDDWPREVLSCGSLHSPRTVDLVARVVFFTRVSQALLMLHECMISRSRSLSLYLRLAGLPAEAPGLPAVSGVRGAGARRSPAAVGGSRHLAVHQRGVARRHHTAAGRHRGLLRRGGGTPGQRVALLQHGPPGQQPHPGQDLPHHHACLARQLDWRIRLAKLQVMRLWPNHSGSDQSVS